MNFQRFHTRENLEINLIPLIDVLLVILIFLMITTTYSKYAEMQINLPTANAQKLLERPNEITVTVNAGGQYTINRRPVQAFAPGRLQVLDPGGDKRIRPGSSLPLKSTTSLGAGRENDVVLRDPYVSDRHAQLTWDGSAWWIEDLGSSNGTHIDGIACPPHVPCQAASGARLSLGEMVFELRI